MDESRDGARTRAPESRRGGLVRPAAAAALAAACFSLGSPGATAQVSTVAPVVETEPVPSGGDAADDACIWVHPTTPGSSVVIGTDKDSGLAVYDLAGNQLQFLPDGSLNNVDLRYGFPLGGRLATIVTAGERDNDVLAVYEMDPSTRRLANGAARVIPLGITIYGSCMYKSPVTGDVYFFGNSKDGEVEQWLLFDDGAGKVDARLVRAFDVGGQTEGCVADDENACFFIAEENIGIWRYGAEPGSTAPPVLVDTTGGGGHLTADVEGLAIYYTAGGGGYLLASSQGSSTFVVYDRAPPHAYLHTFAVGANAAAGIDAVSGTDGIDVINLGLGPAFPGGLFVAQDDENPGANQNFKLFPWEAIAASAVPPLAVDTRYDASRALCPPGTSAYRFGTGVNPFLFTNVAPPELGASWDSELDCSSLGAGFAILNVYGRPATGPIVAAGELLVDLSSLRFARQIVPQTASPVRFEVPVPLDPALCGLQAFAQASCLSPGPTQTLSNAIDLVLGWSRDRSLLAGMPGEDPDLAPSLTAPGR